MGFLVIAQFGPQVDVDKNYDCCPCKGVKILQSITFFMNFCHVILLISMQTKPKKTFSFVSQGSLFSYKSLKETVRVFYYGVFEIKDYMAYYLPNCFFGKLPKILQLF